jgi:hypothetical protein
VLRFFGLTPNDKQFFLDQIFQLMYYMGFSYKEAYLLPVWQRLWFINRTSEEIKKSAEAGNSQSRAAHANSAEQRAMQGNSRLNPPSRLRRFS